MKRKPWQHVSVTRSPENVEILKRMHKANATLEDIGKALGVSRPSVTRMIKALDLPKRAPAPRYLPAKPVLEPKPPKVAQARPEAPQSAPGNAPMRYDFRASPVRFINVDRDQPAIGERILSELSLRPLSTMSLSSVLGEKEAIVGQALSVLRYEGKVHQPSPDIGVGRHVAWAVKPCCDGEIGADSKASGEVFKASPALGITQPREQAA